MHLIFSHYFQAFYSTANDFHPQQLQIRLTEEGRVVGLDWTWFKWIKHTYTGTETDGTGVPSHMHMQYYREMYECIDNLKWAQRA